MAKIEKISESSYRVRKMIKGKSYTLMFDHKPTQKEVTFALAEKLENTLVSSSKSGTMEQYAYDYIDLARKNGRSSTTISGYKSIVKNTPSDFLNIDLLDLTQDNLQEMIDLYARTHSPKSTRNLNGFYQSVLKEYRPTFSSNLKLPQRKKGYDYQPGTKDIQKILEYARDSRYYVFLRLSVIGLRRSEIPCLTKDDVLDDNTLIINKDYVLDEDNKYYIKNTPKTDATNRRILIPEDVAEMIRNTDGMLFKGNLHTVNEYLHKVQDALNIPRFRLHILRHFAAALLLKNGFSVVEVEDFMGWEHGSSTMQKVYAYNLDPEESQKKIIDTFDAFK